MFYKGVFRKLDDENVRYGLVGGVALVLYCVVRLTADLDVFVETSGSNLRNFVRAINGE